MKIEFKSSDGIRFPPLCPCCGEAPDGTQTVRSVSFRARVRTTRTWEVPVCKACIAHSIRFGGAAGWRTQLKAVELILIVFTFGLYAVFWRLFVFPKKEQARAAAAELERTAAKGMCKPSCGDVAGLAYTSRNEIHVFDIPSAAYAKAFVASNAEKIVGA